MSKDSKQQKTPSRPRSKCACFIESVLPELGDLYHVAETSLHEIPAHALVVLRGCAKTFTVAYLRRHKQDVQESTDFISLLEDSVFVSATSKTLRDKLHQIRIDGNLAAHPESEGVESMDFARSAADALESFYQIVVKKCVEGDQEPAVFELPDADSSNRMCGDAVIRDDADAQYRLGLRAKKKAVARIKVLKEEALEGGVIGDPEVSRDFEGAYSWFQKASRDDRSPAAFYQMALLHIGRNISAWDAETGLSFLYKAEELGVADASGKLGLFALEGKVFDSHGRTICDFDDTDRMLEWLEHAASDGNPEALNGLVGVYFDGDRVEVNHARALNYARAAADAGFPLAKLNLAGLYMRGIGEPRESGEVVSLLEAAAKSGVCLAYAHLYEVYLNGDFVEVDVELAEKYLEKGCRRREPYAMVTRAYNSIEGEADEREPLGELNMLLQAIDHPHISAELRKYAQALLPQSVECAQQRAAAWFEGLVRPETLRDGDDFEELQTLICMLILAAATPGDDDFVGVSGIASSRYVDVFLGIEELSNLLRPDASEKENKKAREFLSPLVPQFNRWGALERKRVAQRTVGLARLGLTQPLRKTRVKVGRNDSCPCASGRKYKRCCGVPS